MFDDPYNQWVNFPVDDWSALPSVDEEVSGLKDITSIRDPSDQYINEQPARGSRGLLLGQDLSPILPHSDLLDAITEFYKSPHSGCSLLPPELSPDSSPASSQASSTPWLRTPQSDISLASFNALSTPPASDVLWDIQEIDEYETQCVGTYFVDQSGNNLDDPSSQHADILLEDVACTPYGLSELSLSCPIVIPDPMPSPSGSLPSAFLTPLPPPILTSTSSPLLSPPPPLPSQTFLAPPASTYHRQESLSPLSTLSIFSSSPSPSPAPFPHCTLSPIIPPTVSPMSNLHDEEVPDVTESTRSSRAVMGRRWMDSLDDDAPPPKITRRKVKDLDDDEWKPALERIKRPRISSSQSARLPSTSASPESQANPSQSAHEISPEPGTQPDNTPTSCTRCGVTFTRASDYLRHVENSSLHPDTSKLWKCVYCESYLCRKDALSRHIQSNHIGCRVVIPREGIPRSRIPASEVPQETSAPRLPRRPPTRRPPRRGGRK